MAKHPREIPWLHVAVDEVVVAVAHARTDHVQQHFALARLLDFEVSDGDECLGLFEYCGSHVLLLRLLGVRVGNKNPDGWGVTDGFDGIRRSRLGQDYVSLDGVDVAVGGAHDGLTGQHDPPLVS